MSSSGAGAGIDELYLQREIVQAFDNVKVIDCLDLTPEGVAAWDASMKRYDCVYSLGEDVVCT